MKALIRKEGETVLESDGITGIDWKTGAPLTHPEWCGGPYQLVDNYVEPEDGDGHVPVDVPVEIIEEPAAEDPAEDEPVDPVITNDEYVIIDGVKYRKC